MKKIIEDRVALILQIAVKITEAKLDATNAELIAIFQEVCKDDRMLQTRKYNEDQKAKELKQAKKLISKISEKFK